MPLTVKQLRARARKIKLLLVDVDGVMTDGRIFYVPPPEASPDGETFIETKGFHSRDGFGIRMARESGIRLGLISGRGSPVVKFRAKELGFEFVEEHSLAKIPAYEKIVKAAGVREDEICYVGDDIVDLPVLRRVGLAVGVGSGHPFLKRNVHYWTRAPGGFGAVREIIELILDAQHKLAPILKQYSKLTGPRVVIGAG
jgi:3-deoxy-D-manno-octulosonate 8-phosphate phosphatase (KDO 8-P phosphatase)